MRTRLRRRHKVAMTRLYSGGGILERRILKREKRKVQRSAAKIIVREQMSE